MITCIKSTSSFTRTSWLPLQNTFPLIWRLIHHIVLGNGSQKTQFLWLADIGMPCNSSNVFLLTIRLLVIHILRKAVGRNLVQRRKSNQSKSLLFCLCVFFLEPTNAKRSVIGRSASVPWSWSALRRPHQLRELSQTQPFFVTFHFSVPSPP